MSRRTHSRKLAMQVLYQCEIRSMEISLALEQVFSADAHGITETKLWAGELAKGAWENRQESDKMLIQYAKDWDFDRINLVDKSIIRLAHYELTKTDTPVNVVLNEAIEIAKLFSTDDSPKFINGILGHYVKAECLLAS